MITTIIPYQQATLYLPVTPAPEKDKPQADVTASVGARADSIELSPAARARMAEDARNDAPKNLQAAETAAKEQESLKEAARKTIAALKRHQGREFTARGIEITDPDTSMAGKAAVTLRDVTPQPVILRNISA